MDLPVRKKLPHAIPPWEPEGSWFFITINCVPPGRNQLCRADKGDAVMAAVAHNHRLSIWHWRLALLMPDHLHGIFAFPSSPGMKTTMKNWKKFVGSEHGVNWQRDFFDHRLRSDQELQEKTSYILMNPARKGLCERAEDWIWVYRPNDRLPPQLGQEANFSASCLLTQTPR
jgi:putative transposase